MNSQQPKYPTRRLVFACVFESAALLIAYVAGWLVGIDPLATGTGQWSAAVAGLVAVAPLLVPLWWGLSDPKDAVGKVTRQARDFATRFLAGTGVSGFAVISVLAGIGEEALFRGVIQTFAVLHSTEWVGLIVASLLFGLAHAISWPYAVIATIIGVYLGLLYLYTGNIIAPIVCHAVYDFIALICLTRNGPTRSALS